ncbi:MAG: formylmethanofuran dehydrogenase [Dehalococcoidia bacterium]|nr:formylmethanofuran dehydrogenase [Dehalococcoidia bacterium]
MDIINMENPRQELEKAIAQGDLQKLLRSTGLLHGHYCPGSAMGVKAAARAVNELRVKSTGMEEIIAIVETNSCFADGVQMVTGCSLGNNALIYRDYGKMAVTLARRTGEAVRIAAKPGSLTMEEREPEAMALFGKVVKERQGTEEDDRRLRHMWIEISFRMLEIPDEELFSISRLNIEIPAYARIFASVNCSVCGENVMQPRSRLIDSRYFCLPCSGQAYYQLAGDGMSIIG